MSVVGGRVEGEAVLEWAWVWWRGCPWGLSWRGLGLAMARRRRGGGVVVLSRSRGGGVVVLHVVKGAMHVCYVCLTFGRPR